MNRLGDNIVVFNFITPEVAKQIFQKQLLNVQTRVQACHGLTLEIAPEVIEKLTNLCTNPETLANGGRGIGNRIETLFVNPLSRALFDRVANGPAIVNVTDIETVDGISSVKLV